MAVLYSYPIKSTPANRNDLVVISDSRDGNKTKQIAVANLPGSASFSGIGGSGTVNYIPKFSTSTDLVNSAIYEDSVTGNIGIGNGSALATLDVSKNGLDTDQPIIRITQRKDDTGWSVAEMGRFEFFSSDGSGNSPYNLGYVGISNDYVGGTLPSGAMTFATTPYNATGGSEAAIERMRISSSGDVGIGTTSPDGLLHVSAGTQGDARLILEADTDNNNENDVPQIWFKADGDTTEGLIGLNNNFLDIMSNSSTLNGIRFFTGSTSNIGTTDPYTGATEKMRIMPNGDVGIGTAIPDSILTVKADTANVGIPVIKASVNGFSNGYTLIGDNYITGGSQLNLGVSYSGSNGVLSRGVKVSSTGDNVFLSSQNQYSLYSQAFVLQNDGSFRFLNTSTSANTPIDTAVSLSERMRITRDGAVGIGATAPTEKLEVAGNIKTTGGFVSTVSGYSTLELGGSTGAYIDLKSPSTDDYDLRILSTGSGGSFWTGGFGHLMTLSATGNVGISVTNPAAKLDITDTVNQTAIRVTNNEYNNYLIQKRRTDDTQKLGIKEFGSNGGLALVAGGTERLNINNLGNVGIGTTNPSNKLTVGNISNETSIACASTGFDSLRLGTLTFPAAAGWYRVAQYTVAGARGGARVDLCIVGGDFAPVTYSIDYFKSYTQTGAEHTLKLEQYGGSAFITKARIAFDGTNTFVEVYKIATTSGTPPGPVTMPAQVHFNRLIGESGGSLPMLGTATSGSSSTLLKEVSFIPKGTSVEALRVEGETTSKGLIIYSTGGVNAGDTNVVFDNTLATKQFSIGSGIIQNTQAGFAIRNVTDSRTDVYVGDTGNVGIGEYTPTARLHVSKDNVPDDGYVCKLTSTSTVAQARVLTVQSSYNIGGGVVGDKMYVRSDGDLENINGTYGTIGSDERLKENIIDAKPKLNDILSLKVKNFNFIDNDKKQIGFIAQEFEKVFPSLVKSSDTRVYKTHDENGVLLEEQGELISGYEDTRSLRVGMEFAIITKVIQEQQEIIENLKQRIEQLEITK